MIPHIHLQEPTGGAVIECFLLLKIKQVLCGQSTGTWGQSLVIFEEWKQSTINISDSQGIYLLYL